METVSFKGGWRRKSFLTKHGQTAHWVAPVANPASAGFPGGPRSSFHSAAYCWGLFSICRSPPPRLNGLAGRSLSHPLAALILPDLCMRISWRCGRLPHQ
jgi:hypothetical protein